jgi:hypothetical protein
MQFTKPERGQPILVTLGDKVLEIRFTLEVLRELNREHGISVFKGQNPIAQVMEDPDKLITALYHGLKTKQPDITEQWVAENVDASMFPDFLPYLVYAMLGRWPKEAVARLTDEDEASDAPNPTLAPTWEPTGSLSGASDATISVLANAKSGR